MDDASRTRASGTVLFATVASSRALSKPAVPGVEVSATKLSCNRLSVAGGASMTARSRTALSSWRASRRGLLGLAVSGVDTAMSWSLPVALSGWPPFFR
jgi:hypothetical protein